MMRRYAERTAVPVERTQGEIRALLNVTREKAARVGWVHVFKPGGFGGGRTMVCADYCEKHASEGAAS